MDPRLLDALSNLPTGGQSNGPITSNRNADFNIFAVNEAGDIVVLCSDGRLLYANIRCNRERFSEQQEGSDTQFRVLPVYNASCDDLRQFTNIEFDAGGSLLLLWSPFKVGMVEIPYEGVVDGVMNFPAATTYSDASGDVCCKYTELTDELLSAAGSIDDAAAQCIAKAAFHALCPHSLVVLLERNSLLLMDLRTLKVQVYSVVLPSDPFRSHSSRGSSSRFTSFCFGPCLDWLAFSILLLTASGQVYLLCPVIPKGTMVAASMVADLWDWLDQLAQLADEGPAAASEYYSSSSDSEGASRSQFPYISLAQAYLRETFGERPADAAGGAAEAAGGLLRAGEMSELFEDYPAHVQLQQQQQTGALADTAGMNHMGVLSADAELLSRYVVKLVGPLPLRAQAQLFRGAEASAADATSAEEKDSADISGYSITCRKQKTHATPVTALDICVPGAAQAAAALVAAGAASPSDTDADMQRPWAGVPVLLVSTSIGEVDVLMLDVEVRTPEALLNLDF